MRSAQRRRGRLGAALVAAAAAALLSCGPQDGTTPVPIPKVEVESGAAAKASASPAPPPASLGELPAAVARLEALSEEVDGAIAVDDAEREAALSLDTALERIARIRERVEKLPFDELLEISRRLASTGRSVTETDAIVGRRLRRVEEDARKVAELKKTFDGLATLAGETAAPPAIRLRTGICVARLDELAAKLEARRADVLLLVGKVAEARGSVAAMNAEMESRLVASRRQLTASEEGPIWNLRFPGREALAATGERLARDFRRVRRWMNANSPQLTLLTLLFFGGTVLLLHRLKPGAERRAAADPTAAPSLRVMEHPVLAAVPVTVAALVALSPQAPVVVYDFAWLLSAPVAAWLVTRMIGPGPQRTVWVLAASLALAPITSALSEMPVTDRLAMVLQTAPLAVVLALDLRSGRISGRGVGSRAQAAMKGAAWLLAGALAVAAAGSLLGWVGLAKVLSAGALGTLGGIVLILSTYLVLSGLLRSLVVSRPAAGLRMLREHADLVAETCLRILRLASVVAVVVLSLRAFGLGLPAKRLLDSVLEARATVGSLTISPASILAFFLVLWATSLFSRLLGFVLAEEVLPRFDLRRGTAVAISATTRYLVLIAGFVLASGAAGVDLTKFGFLAGALGVGIGFGLQNIVSNFISGLILLFERPIQVGDAVEIAGASGTVAQIGIRASTVHTFDGSDVIVPNADLISKSVTNWTGSNPNRRFDVPVGVAYGSGMETTAQALLAAARRTPGILPGPAPEAYFQSFGESSLDWTLRVWVRIEDSPKALSDLKRAVSEELAKAGLEVPFPQRDLNIRSVAPGAREALAGPGPSK